MRPLVKRIDMALHIQELCAVNHITVSYQSLDDEIPTIMLILGKSIFKLDRLRTQDIMFLLCMRLDIYWEMIKLTIIQ